MRIKLGISLLVLFCVGVVNAQLPPMPTGMKLSSPKPNLQSPKGKESVSSLGARMSFVPSLVIPPGLVITNITVDSGNVSLAWQGSGTVQVEQSIDFTNWASVGAPVSGNTAIVPTMGPKAYYRLRQIPVVPSGTPLWSVGIIGQAFGKNVRITAVATNSTGTVVCGTYMTNVNFGGKWLTNSSPNIQGFVASYTDSGTLRWVNGFTNGTGLSYPSSITTKGDGIYVSGYFNVSCQIGGQSITSVGFDDIFILRMSNDGALSWVKRYGGARSDWGRNVIVDSTGLVMVGTFSDVVPFGTTILTSAGGLDLFLCRIDESNGEAIGASGYGLGGDEVVYGASTDGDNIYVVGQLIGLGNFGGGPVSNPSAGAQFVVKYSNGFAYQWAKLFGVTGNNYAFGTTTDASGRVLFVGSAQGSIDFGGGSRPVAAGSAITLARFTPDGIYDMDRVFGGTSGGSDVGRTVSTIGDTICFGGTLVSSTSFDSFFLLGATPDIFVAKLTSQGVTQWAKRYGGTDNLDECFGVSGGLYCGGYFNGFVNFDGSGGSWSGPFNCQCGILWKMQP